MKFLRFCLSALAVFCLRANAQAQHLWWNLEQQTNAVCLYGEITVLATYPSIYYCGANWHPGEPAGGYCGIQHNSLTERRTIFSIWDTSPQLHPTVSEADPQTVFNRFGGEGEGGHTHMLWEWKPDETFQFFVQKQPGEPPDATEARYYAFDRNRRAWRHLATIVSPNGGGQSVSTFGGSLNSFLENYAGKDRALPKLALYRLWLGPSIDKLRCLTHARGDGNWGEMHDAYFLAEGDSAKLDTVFEGLESKYGKPAFGGKGTNLAAISSQPIQPDVIAALKNLPRAAKINQKP